MKLLAGKSLEIDQTLKWAAKAEFQYEGGNVDISRKDWKLLSKQAA